MRRRVWWEKPAGDDHDNIDEDDGDDHDDVDEDDGGHDDEECHRVQAIFQMHRMMPNIMIWGQKKLELLQMLIITADDDNDNQDGEAVPDKGEEA